MLTLFPLLTAYAILKHYQLCVLLIVCTTVHTQYSVYYSVTTDSTVNF